MELKSKRRESMYELGVDDQKSPYVPPAPRVPLLQLRMPDNITERGRLRRALEEKLPAR